MSIRSRVPTLALVVLGAFVFVQPVSALPRDPASFAPRAGAKALDRVPLEAVAAPDVAALAAEDEVLDALRIGPRRIGVAIPLLLDLRSAGSLEPLADGGWVWRLRLRAPGASSLDVGLRRFDLPPGASLWLYSPDRTQVRGPYTRADRNPSGRFYTAAIEGEEAVLEVDVPSEAALRRVRVELADVSYNYRSIGSTAAKPGSCNNDVICPEGNPWRDQIRSVARYSFRSGGRNLVCTATLVNNTAQDKRPLFLGAAHCVSTQAEAESVVAYWNFESPVCGQLDGGSLSQSQSGARLVAAHAPTDFSLMELNARPRSEFRTYYAGFDATGAQPPGGVVIHHPAGDEKMISFDDDPLTTANNDISVNPPSVNTHWRVGEYEDGTTEGGSSGSCIFHPVSKRCVGVLTGGLALCTAPDEYDIYGKLSVAWDGGGSASSRLRDHLDPVGGGATRSLDGVDAQGGGGGGGNPGPCAAGTLCLLNNRFEAKVNWTNQYNGSSGAGIPGKFSDASGYFYFTDPANLELIIKVLDFGGGTVKVFYSQLTDLQFTIALRETATGRTKSYSNGPSNCGAIDQSFYSFSGRDDLGSTKDAAIPGAVACSPNTNTLCLLNNRFSVQVDWRNQYNGQSGRGNVTKLSNLTGTVNYGDANNIEQLVKILDFGDRILLFWGALSDLQYTLRVTDTQTGRTKVYDNPAGRYCGGSDTDFNNSGGGGGGGGSNVNEVEPNDSRTQAQRLTGSPKIVSGRAEAGDEGEIVIEYTDGNEDDLEDLYQVQVGNNGNLDITLDGLSEDCDLFLMPADLSVSEGWFSNNVGNASERVTRSGLAAGTYFIGVTVFDPEPDDTTSNYRLTVNGTF